MSVFNGPQPELIGFATTEEEIKHVAQWLAGLSKKDVKPHEIGVFVRSSAELDRAKKAVEREGLGFKMLDEHTKATSGYVSIGTMHLAKGLEFKAVAIMACDDQVLPLQSRIETVSDEADLEEVYKYRTSTILRRVHSGERLFAGY